MEQKSQQPYWRMKQRDGLYFYEPFYFFLLKLVFVYFIRFIIVKLNTIWFSPLNIKLLWMALLFKWELSLSFLFGIWIGIDWGCAARYLLYVIYSRVVQISTFFYFNYGEGGGNFIWVWEHDFKQKKFSN